MAVKKLFNRLKQFTGLKAHVRNIGLDVRLEGDFPRYIYTDKRRLMQVLLNLSYNAIKYTFAGEVTVVAKMKDASTLLVEVRDTGIGIDSEVLSGIFTMFGMVDKKTNAHETGTHHRRPRRNRHRIVPLQAGPHRAWRHSCYKVGEGQGDRVQRRTRCGYAGRNCRRGTAPLPGPSRQGRGSAQVSAAPPEHCTYFCIC